MSWRDQLFDASYKGASFKVKASTRGVGRRAQLHNYINRDKPYLEDLGSEADDYQIEAYIIQTPENFYNYFTDRDNLIRALKSEGPGILIHPFYGIKKVGLIGKANVSETFDEGGIARFSFSLTEAGERAVPQVLEDFLDKVDNAVNAAFDTVGDAFQTAFDTVGSFQDVVANTTTRALGVAQTGIAFIEGIATDVISEALGNISTIIGTVGEIATEPIDLFNALKNSANGFAQIGGMGAKLVEEIEKSYGNPGDFGLATQEHSSDRYANSVTISKEVIGGQTGEYSGITRGEIIQLDGSEIPERLGISLISSASDVADSILDTIIGTSGAIPVEQQRNFTLIVDAMRFSFLANAVRIAIRTSFISQDEAIYYMNIIADALDNFLIYLGQVAADGPSSVGIGVSSDYEPVIDNNDMYVSVEQMRNVFVDSMIKKASELEKLINYTVPTAVQSILELAYNRYGDITRANEIFQINRELITHPGFLPNDETLRILNE